MKAKDILGLIKGADVAKLSKLRETLETAVQKAVGAELEKLGIVKAKEPAAPKAEPTETAETPAAAAVPAVTFKELVADLDKAKVKAFLEGLDKAKVKAWIDAADKEMLKTLVDLADVDALIRYADALESGKDAPETPAAAEAPKTEPDLVWAYGGFDGGKAEVVEDAVLGKAVLKGDTLTFEWAKGDCRDLGATSKTDADHTVACLFLADGKGGKFEWISTSRKTRSVGNIKDGYNGWPKNALDNGGRLFFCIAGVKDDKATSNGKRTALVEVERA